MAKTKAAEASRLERTLTFSKEYGMSRQVHDEEFSLVSMLYHASHGVERSQQHASEANSRSDREAEDFFDNLSNEYSNIADQARMLLKKRV